MLEAFRTYTDGNLKAWKRDREIVREAEDVVDLKMFMMKRFYPTRD